MPDKIENEKVDVRAPTREEARPPFVSVILPVRNEEQMIARTIQSVLAQDYPPRDYELLVADGMSSDASREIVESFAQKSSPIRVIENPDRSMPSGFNRAVKVAKGGVIVLLGGHCELPQDFFSKCVSHLIREAEAACVGGVIEAIGDTLAAKSIAIAQSSFFGVGGVAFRTGREERSFVDTVAFGAYRQEVFEMVGFLDEELLRNQDDEFNFRILQSGGKILLDPAIKVKYYSRASFAKLWSQYFQYGFFKVRVMQKRGQVLAFRHLIPSIFVLGLAFTLAAGMVASGPFISLSVLGPYLFFAGVASLVGSKYEWKLVPLVFIAFVVLHVSYGVGLLVGLWKWRKYGYQFLSPRRWSVVFLRKSASV